MITHFFRISYNSIEVIRFVLSSQLARLKKFNNLTFFKMSTNLTAR